jgi:hypothetical protein
MKSRTAQLRRARPIKFKDDKNLYYFATDGGTK